MCSHLSLFQSILWFARSPSHNPYSSSSSSSIAVLHPIVFPAFPYSVAIVSPSNSSIPLTAAYICPPSTSSLSVFSLLLSRGSTSVCLPSPLIYPFTGAFPLQPIWAFRWGHLCRLFPPNLYGFKPLHKSILIWFEDLGPLISVKYSYLWWTS